VDEILGTLVHSADSCHSAQIVCAPPKCALAENSSDQHTGGASPVHTASSAGSIPSHGIKTPYAVPLDPERGAGTTSDPEKAAEEGLSYQAPQDPPIVSSEQPGGAEFAAGFGPSMEATKPSARVPPSRAREGDSHIADNVRRALRHNSETAHLRDIHIRVENRVVYLTGTVQSFDDIARVDAIVSGLDNVDRVHSELEVPS